MTQFFSINSVQIRSWSWIFEKLQNPDPIQISKSRYSPDPVQSKSRPMLISAGQ